MNTSDKIKLFLNGIDLVVTMLVVSCLWSSLSGWGLLGVFLYGLWNCAHGSLVTSLRYDPPEES